MAKALFIAPDDIPKKTVLNGNVDRDEFLQFVEIAQDTHIKNFLGSDLFNKINDDIVASTLASPYTTLVSNYVKAMTIHWAMVEYLPWAAYSVDNRGVFKHVSENGETVSKEEVDFLIEKQRGIAQGYTDDFIRYMIYNQSSYPEYTSNSNEDKHPDTDVNLTGWAL